MGFWWGEWKTTGEELPEDGQLVLAFNSTYYFAYGFRRKDGGFSWCLPGDYRKHGTPTHWMPLPLPPDD